MIVQMAVKWRPSLAVTNGPGLAARYVGQGRRFQLLPELSLQMVSHDAL